MNAMVYINNQLAAQCPNGYSTFYVKADDYLIYGQENEIRVSAKTEAMTNSRWYSGSGIYRDVYYLEASKLHLAPDETRITCKTADPSPDTARHCPGSSRNHRKSPVPWHHHMLPQASTAGPPWSPASGEPSGNPDSR